MNIKKIASLAILVSASFFMHNSQCAAQNDIQINTLQTNPIRPVTITFIPFRMLLGQTLMDLKNEIATNADVDVDHIQIDSIAGIRVTTEPDTRTLASFNLPNSYYNVYWTLITDQEMQQQKLID